MQPAPGPGFWPGFILLQHDHYCTAHCPLLQAAFYGVISASLMQSASKYGPMQPGHCAVPVRRSLRCSPGVQFGSKHFTNRVQTHHHRLHQTERLPLLPPPGSLRLALVRLHRPLVACRRVLGPHCTIPRACAWGRPCRARWRAAASWLRVSATPLARELIGPFT
jgi:hypothetical protein